MGRGESSPGGFHRRIDAMAFFSEKKKFGGGSGQPLWWHPKWSERGGGRPPGVGQVRRRHVESACNEGESKPLCGWLMRSCSAPNMFGGRGVG